jgi:hypothetical protein
MTSTAKFLAHILPHEGWYAGAIFQGTVVNHLRCATVDALADELVAKDQQGLTVYHACGAFLSKEGRKQTNARSARAFWLDLDAGLNKPYANARAAYQDCERFRTELHLPQPTYAASGTGVHVYWVLAKDLDPQKWLTYATALKAACIVHKLHAGTERTADIASILRPPGTHHRKAEPKLVKVGPLTGPHRLDQFAGLLKYATPTPTATYLNLRETLEPCSTRLRGMQATLQFLADSFEDFNKLLDLLTNHYVTLATGCSPSALTAWKLLSNITSASTTKPIRPTNLKINSRGLTTSQGPPLASASTNSIQKSAKTARTGRRSKAR